MQVSLTLLALAVHKYAASGHLVLSAEKLHIYINCPTTPVARVHVQHAPGTVTVALPKAPDRYLLWGVFGPRNRHDS